MRLDDYLARVEVSRPLPPTIETLRRLHMAHLHAFPFDNLTIQRHGTVRTDLESIEQKFLDGRTGGYCFEHNTLFGAVLRELGFDASLVLGRVGSPERPLNHLVVRVTIDGNPWLADVGYGGDGPLEPLPIREGTRVVQDGLIFSLQRESDQWMLSMQCGDRIERLYAFGDSTHTPADVAAANDHTSNHPSSVFRRTLTIQQFAGDERIILRATTLTRYRDGVRTETQVEPSRLRSMARELFGIEVGEEPLLFETLDS